MDVGCGNQEEVPNNLRKQLALAVRSLQWSYAIFWSISSNNPGVLEWVDGYYNGDIKTRKTVQATEANVDQLGLQRSEQLRELYESLKVGESNPQARRPSAALSPEDLSDAEWYYLVCMSFTFNTGQGLPGKTLEKNQTIWLCNVHQADSKTFSRSLLAKSASIQTVVCFPHLGGVVELGVTEEVSEDPNFVQHVKTSFLEIPYRPISRNRSYVSENARNDEDINGDLVETSLSPFIKGDDVIVCSPNNSSNVFENIQLEEDPYIIDGINREASQVQSWNFIDDEVGDHVLNSMNSSDSISQTYGNTEKITLVSDGKKVNDGCRHENQEYYDQKERVSFDSRPGEDVYYHSILSNLLKSSHQLILGPYFRNENKYSSFVGWKKEALLSVQKTRNGTPQRLLKKVLFQVPKMQNGSFIQSSKDDGKRETVWQQEVEMDNNDHLSEKKLKEKINERFMILTSLVPTNGKVDKVSILDDTIEYLKELERRIKELESKKKVVPKTRRNLNDTVERTSDNYGANETDNRTTEKSRKRKSCETDDLGPLGKQNLQKNRSTDDVSVTVIDKDSYDYDAFPFEGRCVARNHGGDEQPSYGFSRHSIN